MSPYSLPGLVGTFANLPGAGPAVFRVRCVGQGSGWVSFYFYSCHQILPPRPQPWSPGGGGEGDRQDQGGPGGRGQQAGEHWAKGQDFGPPSSGQESLANVTSCQSDLMDSSWDG